MPGLGGRNEGLHRVIRKRREGVWGRGGGGGVGQGCKGKFQRFMRLPEGTQKPAERGLADEPSHNLSIAAVGQGDHTCPHNNTNQVSDAVYTCSCGLYVTAPYRPYEHVYIPYLSPGWCLCG